MHLIVFAMLSYIGVSGIIDLVTGIYGSVLYLVISGLSDILFVLIVWQLRQWRKWLPIIVFVPTMVGYYSGFGLEFLIKGLVLPVSLIILDYYFGYGEE